MPPRTVPVECFDFVAFGGTGDLALRKLLPPFAIIAFMVLGGALLGLYFG